MTHVSGETDLSHSHRALEERQAHDSHVVRHSILFEKAVGCPQRRYLTVRIGSSLYIPVGHPTCS